MNKIRSWIQKQPMKQAGEKAQSLLEGGLDPYDINKDFEVVGTAKGANGPEAITDEYASWFKSIGWDKFNYEAFAGSIHQDVLTGMPPHDAVESAYADLFRNNQDLAEKAEKSARNGPPTAKSRDAAQALAMDVIHAIGAKPEGPTARQIEADIARYLDAGFPPGAAAATARANAKQAQPESEPSAVPESQQPAPDGAAPKGSYYPPQEGAIETKDPQQQQASADIETNAGHESMIPDAKRPVATETQDPRAEAMVQMASSPVTDPARAALLKPAGSQTAPEVRDMMVAARSPAQGEYGSLRNIFHVAAGNAFAASDGPTPVAMPTQPAPHVTADGEDLWQATGRVGRQVAAAAATDGLKTAVMGLQRGLNILNQPGTTAAAPPVAEDGQYGPQTDFALKHAAARLGGARVEDALALGRFNTFARAAEQSGSAEGLDDATHAAFAPVLRAPGDDQSLKVEGGVLQRTLNEMGAAKDDSWEPLKVDTWIGPKTTEAFGTVLADQGADDLTAAFGRALGMG